MKCFYHTDRDAVGTCSQCGRACCRECIKDVGGALLCKGCMSLAEVEVTAQEAAEQEEAVQLARKSIRWSWIITIVLGSITAIVPITIIGETRGASLLFVPFAYYAIWSWYWGLKGLGPWWDEHISKGREPGWPSLIMIYCLAVNYGILGGGIRQYRIHRQIAQLSPVGETEEQMEKLNGAGAQLRGLLKGGRYDEIISLISKNRNVAFELVTFLENLDDEIRGNAAETIRRIGKDDAQTPGVVKVIMPRLLTLLKDPRPQARSAATRALIGIAWNGLAWSDIQELIEPAIPHLIELLDDLDVGVRKNAIEAIQAVSEWMEDKGGNVQQLTMAIPSITHFLKDEELRSGAIWALRAIAHMAPEMAPEMVKPLLGEVSELLKDPNDSVRLGATITLRHLAEPYPELVKPVCSSLVALLEDPWDTVNKNAALVLGFIASEDPEIVEQIMPKLTELLGDQRSEIRKDSVRVLAKIAEVNPEMVKPAVGKLTELLQDLEECVRESAAQVLQRLDYEHEGNVLDETTPDNPATLHIQQEQLRARLRIMEERLGELDSLKEEIENLKATKATVQQLDQRLLDNEEQLRELSNTFTSIKNQLQDIERQVASVRSQARKTHDLLHEQIATFDRSRKRLWRFNLLLFLGILVVSLFLFAPETTHTWLQTLSNWINDWIIRIQGYFK